MALVFGIVFYRKCITVMICLTEAIGGKDERLTRFDAG